MGVPIWTTLLLLVLSTRKSWQISLPSDPTYQAAIVEFVPSQAATSKMRLKENLAAMTEIIASDQVDGLDILVFPEYVLNNMDMKTYVPDPNDKISPCETTNYDYFLTTLSCAARSRNIYLAINVVEKQLCADSLPEDCDESGMNTYNTNVVFDRRGRVISRYRKSHLYRYEWYNTNVLSKPELATFETDFGVTFGHFICFDMLFYEPALMLVKELNITDIIYPTYWFSELPFLTSVQLQEGWAYSNDVNLLAADSSLPAMQNTGSGIYAGKFGRLTAVIHEEPTTVVLRAEVPKVAYRSQWSPPTTVQPMFVPKLETPRFSRIGLLRDYNVDLFTTKLLDEDFTDISEKVCHGQFCCQFSGKRTFISGSNTLSAYRYRLVAYDGSETTFQQIDPSELGVCAIITCTNADLSSCGRIFPEGVRVGNKYYFNSLNVTGSFRHAERRLIMPSTVDARIMPLSLSQFEFEEIDGDSSTWVSIALTTPNADLLTFGIYANYYSQQGTRHNLDPPNWQSGAYRTAAINVSGGLLIVVLYLSITIFLK